MALLTVQAIGNHQSIFKGNTPVSTICFANPTLYTVCCFVKYLFEELAFATFIVLLWDGNSKSVTYLLDIIFKANLAKRLYPFMPIS